ncbi:uncharacterized protein DNG_08433 [Cephalotrichum gorgonifer]|uniref:XRCC4 coiled-coil domain-containing protein n=1 Tax=Cephalotrichum gorgonifer TaxID=2041049 RepID=A0AAE8SYC4_9PEZI|nr:uncharacterized protein DNG_08433 [Cephalotrichum gorgonifer]
MAPTPTILRFPQSRKKSAFVLIQAVSTGRHPLDLRLVGTDGFSPFIATYDEWEETLVSLLSQQAPEGVQATAKIEEGRDADDPPTHLIIEVRRSIQGITKHLGDVTLRYKEEEPIDVVEWCSSSVLAHEETRASLARESDRAAKQEKEIENLQSQLNEFIEAKKADEAGLMEKFRDLLNEKKVKIREQQRLLASAPLGHVEKQEQDVAASGVGGSDIKIEEEEEEGVRGHKALPSRRSKRKTVAPEEDSSDDAFETMEVDEEKGVQRDSEDNQTTDTGSDGDVTASEDDSDGPSAATKVVASESKAEKEGGKRIEAPPPPRELPFAGRRGAKPKAKPKPPPQTPENDTESDDEL